MLEERLFVLVVLVALFLVFLIYADLWRNARERHTHSEFPSTPIAPAFIVKSEERRQSPTPPETPAVAQIFEPVSGDASSPVTLPRQYSAWTLPADQRLLLEESGDGAFCHVLADLFVMLGDELEIELLDGTWLRGRYEWSGHRGDTPRLIAWMRRPWMHPTIESTGYALLLHPEHRLRWPSRDGVAARVQGRLPPRSDST